MLLFAFVSTCGLIHSGRLGASDQVQSRLGLRGDEREEIKRIDIAIIGGGPCGLATALALRQEPCLRDASIAIFERDYLEPKGAAIILKPLGVNALNAIDRRLVRDMRRNMVHRFDSVDLTADDVAESDLDSSGLPADFVQPYRKRALPERLGKWFFRLLSRLSLRKSVPIYRWHGVRNILAKRVLDICGPATLRLGHTLVAIRNHRASDGVDLVFAVKPATGEDSPQADASSVTYRARLVCAADGVRSPTRRYWPGADTATNTPQGRSLWYGLARLRLDDGIVRSVRHDGRMVFVLPTVGSSGACFSCNAPEISGYAKDCADAKARCLSSMPRELWPTVLPILNATPHIYETKLWSRDFSRPWQSPSKRLCFVGDAAHPMWATFGYGTSVGFEDAIALARVARNAGSLGSFIDKGVRTFEAARLDRVRPVVEINREAALRQMAGAGRAETGALARKLEQILEDTRIDE